MGMAYSDKGVKFSSFIAEKFDFRNSHGQEVFFLFVVGVVRYKRHIPFLLRKTAYDCPGIGIGQGF